MVFIRLLGKQMVVSWGRSAISPAHAPGSEAAVPIESNTTVEVEGLVFIWLVGRQMVVSWGRLAISPAHAPGSEAAVPTEGITIGEVARSGLVGWVG